MCIIVGAHVCELTLSLWLTHSLSLSPPVSLSLSYFFYILISECNGTASSIAQTNWTNAYWQCRTEGKILSNMGAHALFNESYFWTGHYIRFSEWIKIIGKCWFGACISIVPTWFTPSKQRSKMWFKKLKTFLQQKKTDYKM